ncbi:protein CLEC16A-like [Cryptosporidium felis]|nr:protein CLEC16A-like [Cryptosporidium felis]
MIYFGKEPYSHVKYRRACLCILEFSLIVREDREGNYLLDSGTGNTSNKELVESIRVIAEVLIWEDQNEEQGFFDLACEFQIFQHLVEFVVSKKVEYPVRRQSLQTISILLQNLQNLHTLYYILSNNLITKLLNKTFNSEEFLYQPPASQQNSFEFELTLNAITREKEEEGELLSYYIILLRTLALRLNKETLRLFLTEALEFPLWKNACFYVNHQDSMIRNTSRNVLLNILRSGQREVIEFFILEEIHQFNQPELQEAMRHLEINSSFISRDSFGNISLSYSSSPSTILQIIISSLIKEIHQLAELGDRTDFSWPEIQSYMGPPPSTGVMKSNNLKNISPINATSPITLSYVETEPETEKESRDTSKVPVVKELDREFFDYFINPLKRQVEGLLDLLELFNEFVILGIKDITWLFQDSILHQVFEMVIFQNIVNKISLINQGLPEKTLSIKIYLFIAYQFLLFFYSNNQGCIYNDLIKRIWEKFFKLGRKESLFGNIFSTLVNYLQDDSEFVILFGLVGLFLRFRDDFKDSRTTERFEYSEKFHEKMKDLGIKEESESEKKNLTVNIFQSFLTNISDYFKEKDEFGELMEEISTENRREITTIEIEYMGRSQKGIETSENKSKRHNSLPRRWRFDKNKGNSKEPESSERILKDCLNYKKVNANLEQRRKELELELKREFQVFYSKLNLESLPKSEKNFKEKVGKEGYQEYNFWVESYEYWYLLLLTQFLERVIILTEKNSGRIKWRPLCLFLVTFLVLETIVNHETIRINDHIKDFNSLLGRFIRFIKCITLGNLGDLLKVDLSTWKTYCSIFEEMSNINYMICEHLFEWRDEDELLITRLFENREKTKVWIEDVISSFCILPVLNTSPKSEEFQEDNIRFIWNLIDTYPILRWFPPNSSFDNTEHKNDQRSIYIDKLRSDYNNLQILTVFTNLVEKAMECKRDKEKIQESSEAQEKGVLCFEPDFPCSNPAFHSRKQLFRKLKIQPETKIYRISILRGNKPNSGTSINNKLCCNAILDLNNSSLLFILSPNQHHQRTILVANFNLEKCKPVPIITRSLSIGMRHLIALLVRYQESDLEKHIILKNLLYQLPLREDLSNSPNISKGAIIQPKKTPFNGKIYHLNNLLLPAYTRVTINKVDLGLKDELSFNDYALYIEFESKKKSQDFLKRLNQSRKDIFLDSLLNTYSTLFDEVI